ncbi:hypothetical protein B484DRAFT_27791 [Ochromonadaceae sp. CCMP2298]|nr:hypothetical protein B484DRAFT_27791 [Ochromonadaceae sp. CCMP2298]
MAGKSQLELYLESLEEPQSEEYEAQAQETQETSQRKSTKDKGGGVVCGVVSLFFFLVVSVLHGSLQDALLVCDMLLQGRSGAVFPHYSKSISEVIIHTSRLRVPQLTPVSALRRMVLLWMVVWCCVYLRRALCAPAQTTTAPRHTFPIFLLLCALLPPAVGAAVGLGLRGLVERAGAAQGRVGVLVGVLRRVQLVALGASLSHPLPPLARLEAEQLKGWTAGDRDRAGDGDGTWARDGTASCPQLSLAPLSPPTGMQGCASSLAHCSSRGYRRGAGGDGGVHGAAEVSAANGCWAA